MKKVGVIIGSIISATAVTLLSPAIIRTEVSDVCHVYNEAGFPLSFIETLQTQPSNDQCLSAALSKGYPTYNFKNMAIDWAIYFVVSAAGLSVIGKKKRYPQASTSQEKQPHGWQERGSKVEYHPLTSVSVSWAI